ncbi:MAG: hypothetical protein Q7J72_00725 [Candidatus Omnitrophota bacterium]|nr:hypothetical protein [Candidatus Omnitrophota bacterium]
MAREIAVVINYLSSYDRSFKKLDVPAQRKTVSAINNFLSFLGSRQKPEGLGLKKIYKNYWEIRINIRNRIIFQLEGGVINISFVGDHNAVRVFIRKP